VALLVRSAKLSDDVWQLREPSFRVDLWRQQRLEDVPVDLRPKGLRQADMGWERSEWELSGGDMDAVLVWADEQLARGWATAEVWVVVSGSPDDPNKGMVRVRGYNPAAGEG